MGMNFYRFLTAGMLIAVLLFISPARASSSLQAEQLRVDGLTQTLAIASDKPLLSWSLAARPGERAVLQTASQVQAASKPELLAANTPDLWNSGQIKTEEPGFCRYGGQPLLSAQRIYWRVRLWDQAGEPGPWSEPDWFETGLLKQSDWTSSWIGMDPSARGTAAPYFRGTIPLEQPVTSARAYISGLGWNELYINGTRIGNHVLDPAQTDYRKRCFYVAYDVTDAVNKSAAEGKMAVGVILGDGWFNQTRVWGGMSYGEPRLRVEFVLTHPDGSQTKIGSDDGWKTKTGPIVADNVYAGESYDARKGLGDWATNSALLDGWTNVVDSSSATTGDMIPQTMPPIRRIREIAVKSIQQIKPGTWIYDFGENVAGWARLKIKAEPGTTIRLRFAEKHSPDGGIDTSTTGVRATTVEQIDTYTANGAAQGETWEPRFTYHGFQYVELTVPSGKLLQPPDQNTLTSIVLHSDFDPTGEFHCSDPQLNRLHDAAVRTMLANVLGVPTDCPARERCGWTGDAQTAAEYEMLNDDATDFFRKYVRDIQTGANPAGISTTAGWGFTAPARQVQVPAGIPNMIAPGLRQCDMASPEWGSAIVFIPWRLYCMSGDRSILEEFRNSMETWTDFLISQRHADGMLYTGLGDWCAPGMNAASPAWIGNREIPLTSTAMLIWCLSDLAQTERLLGDDSHADHYEELNKEEARKWLDLFFQQKDLSQRSQTALSFGVAIESNPAKRAALFAALLQKTEGGRNFTTGIFGTPRVLQELDAAGQAAVARELLTKPAMPSYRAMLDLGATTLWESWSTSYASYTASMSHPMQGAFDAWLYEDVAGLGARSSGTGPWKFRWNPDNGIEWAAGRYRSNLGLLKSSWEKAAGTVTWRICVPPGAEGEISFPDLGPDGLARIKESGRPLSNANNSGHPWLLSHLIVDDGLATRQLLQVGSGDYSFSFPSP